MNLLQKSSLFSFQKLAHPLDHALTLRMDGLELPQLLFVLEDLSQAFYLIDPRLLLAIQENTPPAVS